jgi:hypothetical protein
MFMCIGIKSPATSSFVIKNPALFSRNGVSVINPYDPSHKVEGFMNLNSDVTYVA